MKKLILSLLSVLTLISCDPAIKIDQGAQNNEGTGGSPIAGQDVTSLMRSFLRDNTSLVGSCQVMSTSPMLWTRPMVNAFSSLEYGVHFYSDSSCSDYEGSLSLEFDFIKISTTTEEDEYIMQLELINTNLYVSNPSTYPEEEFYDFTPRVGEFFFWKFKINSAVPDSDVSMPNYEHLKQISTESAPIESTEMFYVSRGG